MNFGVFFAPFHPVGQSPTLALEYDLDRAVALDRLGYDEVWFGEHHSGGYELIGSPEIFIAAAAERTKRIKLGTGVVSLPYHHPWLVADRWVLLDHLTKGRTIFGAGPGALPSDAFVMGIDPLDQRRMMEESLEAILALLSGDEPVTRETDWFTMRDARLQMRPYSRPQFEIAVAAMLSPSGPRLAGKYDASLLSLSMQATGGFAAVGTAWSVVEEQAARAGHSAPDRSTWRILGNMHLAESRDQAIADCTYGLKQFSQYFGGGAGFVPLAAGVDPDKLAPTEFVQAYADTGTVVVGTPDDAIAYIQGLIDQSGGFGTFLMLGHDWASPAATLHSYELFARYVMPHFQGQLDAPRQSHDLGHPEARRAVPASGRGDPQRRAAARARGRRGTGRHGRGGVVVRAVALRGQELHVRHDVAEPTPEAGQVLVSVKACGICGSDLHFAKHAAEMKAIGEEMGGLPMRPPSADLSQDVFMGHEFAAEVLEAGPGTDTFAPGTLVTSVPVLLSGFGMSAIGFGNAPAAGYGERMVLSAPLLLEVPNGLEARRAALTEPMAVGLHAVNKARLEPGDGTVVLGCGPVGLAVIAALRLRGVETILAADFSPARRALAARMGATQVIDPAAESAFDIWLTTYGTKPPVVFEAVGVTGMIDAVLRDVVPQTRVVIVGVCMGRDPITPLWAITKELNLQFVLGYDLEEFAGTLRSIAQGEVDVDPLITGEVGLDGVPGAFAALGNPERHCKILVTP